MRTTRVALGALLLFVLGASANAATFTIRPGAGFTDQTPVSPTPGNPATTLGQARLNVLNEAGRIWGSLLVSSVPIIVDATFEDLDCEVNSATLAAARPTMVFVVDNGPIRDVNVLYVSALADSLRRTNLMAMTPTPNAADIEVSINSRINNDPLCAFGGSFYLGFDHNPPFGQQDLLTALLHEFAHGLGFISLVNLDPDMRDQRGQLVPVGGSLASNGQVSSYDRFVFDEMLGMPWTALMPAQRADSAARSKRVSWAGTNVNANLTFLTAGRNSNNNRLLLFAPTPIVPGSSIAHFDSDATPDILMEPNLSSSLPGNTDVTVCALRDIGWQVTACPDFTSTTTSTPTPPVTSSPPTTPPPTDAAPPRRRGGGGGALYWPWLIALAGLVPLRSRLRRTER